MSSITKVLFSKVKIFLLIVLCTAIFIAPFLIIYLTYPDIIKSIDPYQAHNQNLFRAIRWGIIIVFLLSWSKLIHWIGKRTNASFDKIQQWQSEIYRIAIWLVLFELLICENVLFKVINFLSSLL